MSLLNLRIFSRNLKSSARPDLSPMTILEKEGYSFGKVLAEGSYCVVRVAKKDNQKFAVKIIKHAKKSPEFLEKFLPRELRILTTVDHRNIIKVHRICRFSTHTYIFMDLIESGDLLDYIRRRGRLDEEEARRYFRQLVAAVQYLHFRKFCHRDLKCENIMITEDDQVKLVDFGFARSCVNEETGKRVLSQTYCGSTAYAAPEILLGRPYNPMMYDIWSLGCILFIMVVGSMPFNDSNVKAMVKNQLKRRIRFSGVCTTLSSELKDLIRHMLEPDITKRATLEQVVKNPWFRGLHSGRNSTIKKVSSTT